MASVRRLAAIMFTDMVGSTAAAQADEFQALKLRDEQEALVRPLFAAHQGREIKSMGDGFLVEFDSALRAVQCAIDIQQRLHERNAQPGVIRIQLRIGVHLGDVEQRGNDIFGDAVNIASRIEPLAPPAGLCISGPVFDQVRNKIPNRLEKFGPKSLKGVQVSMDVYRVVLPWTVEERPPGSSGLTRLAVLPFANISPDPKDEYFADGLTEELISVLSQIRGLRVISRTSVNQYKQTTKSIAQIGSELGADSILEGSVRKAGDQLRIAVQLIDTRTDEHRWAHTYDRTLDNVFAIQAEVAERTAGALKIELLRSEREAIQERPTASLAAYEFYLRGIQAWQKQAAGESVPQTAAATCFEDAIREDPGFSAAYSYLANYLLGVMGAILPAREVVPRAREAVAKAFELNPNSSDTHTARGNLAMQADLDWTNAEAEFQQAIALNPSSSAAHFWYGFLIWHLQRFDEAKKQFLAAIELDPLWLLPRINLVWIHEQSGELGSAISLCEKLSKSFGDSPSIQRVLAYLYAVAGRADDAVRIVEPLKGASDLASRGKRAGVLALLGRPEEIRALLGEWEEGRLTEYISLADVAACCAFLGDAERALALLERDYREGDKTLWVGYGSRLFDPIRGDPRFVAMLKTMKLPTRLVRPVQFFGAH